MARPWPAAAQSKQAPKGGPQKFIFLLPEGFKGWVCVDFSIADAASLPREGDALVIRPRPGEVLKTSDKEDTLILDGEAWYEAVGQRKPLPKDVSLQPGVSRTGPSEATERRCAFVGTQDEREAAGGRAPGFENLSRGNDIIPLEERKALEALYNATDGDHWKHRVGWLGPAGTECDWHGIICANPVPPAGVTDIELSNNDLTGDIPEALARLTHLESINITSNNLSGRLPPGLLQKWLTGSLWIRAEPSAFTDVTEVDFESASTSLLCARDRIILRSDGTATRYSEKCRNKTPQDRATYCEVGHGQVLGGEFGTIAVLLEKNRFYSLRRKYSLPVTDSGFDSLRVTRAGKTYEVVEYAGGSPYEFWIIKGFLAAYLAGGTYESKTSMPKCPRWEKGRVP